MLTQSGHGGHSVWARCHVWAGVSSALAFLEKSGRGGLCSGCPLPLRCPGGGRALPSALPFLIECTPRTCARVPGSDALDRSFGRAMTSPCCLCELDRLVSLQCHNLYRDNNTFLSKTNSAIYVKYPTWRLSPDANSLARAPLSSLCGLLAPYGVPNPGQFKDRSWMFERLMDYLSVLCLFGEWVF